MNLTLRYCFNELCMYVILLFLSTVVKIKYGIVETVPKHHKEIVDSVNIDILTYIYMAGHFSCLLQALQ